MHDFMTKAVRLTRPLFVAIIGTVIVLAGVVMIVLPLPSLPVILAGLAILGTEFVWAKSLLASVKAIIVKRKDQGP